ncbi:MAG: tetratricopeptide repeat protein [Planctomycetes bacterium]|nr:tetratricopeptide repeat protein [Planctomycetota bacterium]
MATGWRLRPIVILILCACILTAALVVTLRGAWSWYRPLPRLEQIRAWADAGRWEQAAGAIRLHLERRPHDPAVLMLGARIAAAQGQLQRCTELLEQVPSGSSQKLQAMLRQGQALRDAGRVSRAEQVWREALAMLRQQPAAAPWRQTIQAELVSLLSLERRAPEARELLWQMYPGHSEKWRLLIALARLQGRGTNPQVALVLLDEFIQRDPTDVEARLGRARYLAEASRWQEAKEDAKQCRSQDPHNPRILEVVLQCDSALQQWDAADQLLHSPDLDPTSPTIWRLRAMRYKAQGDWKNSEACFEQSLGLKPTDPVTHYQFAQLLLLSSDRQRAAEHQEQFQKLDAHRKAVEEYLGSVVNTDPESWKPPDPEQCVELAEHIRALGRTDEARGWLSEALRQQPDHRDARQALERLSG